MTIRRVQILWSDAIQDAQVIVLDASISERHSLTSTVTDHPVESGINVSDHIRPEPLLLTIEGLISNTPLFVPSDHSDGAQEIQVEVEGRAPTIGNTIGRPIPILGGIPAITNARIPFTTGPVAVVRGFEPEFNRVRSVYDDLNYIRTQGLLVTVVTSLRDYPNMAITSVEIPRDASLGNVLKFTMQLKEVRIGATAEAPAPVLPTKKTNKGNKVATEAAPEPPDDSTFLSRLLSP